MVRGVCQSLGQEYRQERVGVCEAGSAHRNRKWAGAHVQAVGHDPVVDRGCRRALARERDPALCPAL